MKIALFGAASALVAAIASGAEPTGETMTDPSAADLSDPYRWLEEIDGRRALRWVKARNRATGRTLASRASFKALRQRLVAVFDSEDRIPALEKFGDHYYNFWRDTDNPRGVWRRTTLAQYRRDEPDWEDVLDLDRLARKERENWVHHNFICRVPDYQRCLVRLSRGGADAVVSREFDLQQQKFVKPSEGGFVLPEAKSTVAWAGRDSLFVATDFGPGTKTEAGYPRIVKLLRRGQPLADAETIFEGEDSDVAVSAYADLTPGFELQVIWRAMDFYNDEVYIYRDGKPLRLAKPSDAEASMHRGRLFIELKSEWSTDAETYAAGSLLACDLNAFLDGSRAFDILFEPGAGTSLAAWSPTRNHVLLNVLDNVKNRVYVATPSTEGWSREALFAAQGFGTVSATPVDSNEDDRYFLHATDYLTPPTYSLGAVGAAPDVLKRQPGYFDASGLAVAQHWATSADGTRIPYFQVARHDQDRPQPTLLYGYGGFEAALLPSYSAGVGIAWLERGGVYAVANIRGGGEFGPAWHQAALKENRVRAFEDFIAVAEDLVRRNVTEPAQLGILGGSNGGLLVGAMLTMRPSLFGAVAAQVPLFDMRRYHRLLAGASWMAEFGDPDNPTDWRFLRTYSPYHNVYEDADYPPLLVTTSTRDDRVHPGHARKMVAKMKDMGHNVTYFENIEGGHGGAADNAQSAFMWALVYEFLWRRLAR